MATATANTTETPRTGSVAAATRRKVDIKEVAISTFKEFSQDDCGGVAAESAYHILFSIFPLALFAAAMSGIVDHVYKLGLFDKIMGVLTARLPQEAADTLSKPLAEVLQSQNGGALSLSVILALWSGSGAISTFTKGLNRAYDVQETRPIWKVKLLQIGLTLLMGLLASAAFVLITFGGKIGDAIAGSVGLGTAFQVFWNLARWLIVLAFISLALAVLYWSGPNIDQEFKWLSPGALLATVVWVLAIGGFGIYVSKFGSYNKTYGTLGGVIVLLLVFYLSSMIVLLGGELNSELGKRYDPEAIADIAAHPEKDKGETIYADSAPKKKQADRETDLKGAEARGEPLTNRTAPTAKNASGKTRLVNYATGKREEPEPADPNAAYTMTVQPRSRSLPQGEPSKGGLIGVGILAAGALGLAAKKMLGK